MKVRNVDLNNEFHNINVSDGKRGLLNIDDSFQTRLKNINYNNISDSLHMLADNIIEQGKLVCSRCDMNELRKYKELVSSFLKDAVSCCFEFEKESKFSSCCKHRIFANIKKINNNLTSLTEEILKNQKNSIEILKNVEEIKGLVLDIIL